MKRKLLFSSAFASALLASGAMAQVVNFHDDHNAQLTFPGVYYNELYAGQGAYSDPGNNIWNGFGDYGGAVYQSTDVYSGSSGSGGAWPQQFGNPGNPYAAYNNGSAWVTSSGTNLFDFAAPAGLTVSGNADSSGKWTPITLSVSTYDADNGLGNCPSYFVPNGTPEFLLGEMAYRNGEPNGTGTEIGFDLGNVPAGTYGLYLYGANFPDNRGTLFSVSSGNAHNGIAATLNGNRGKPAPTFVEGQNFVIFENVTPDASGYISITASANPQDGVGNINSSNETCVNGFQLIFNPPPTALLPTAAQNVLAGGTASFSFTPAFASNPSFRWQSIIGGVTNNLSDGGGISGSGTTNLTVTGVTSANVGLYQCRITTATATNTSPAAPLTIVSSTVNRPLQAGDPATLISDVLQPGDTPVDLSPSTVGIAGTVYPWVTIPPPFLMSVTNADDGTLYQWENFGVNLDTPPFVGPVGFVVTPSIGPTILKGLRIFTASSHPEDDPADYLVEGSTDGGVTFTPISGGLLGLPAQRNAADGAINVSNQVLKEIDFANSTAYTTYQLTFSNVNNNAIASNGVKVAEVQLLGSLPAVAPGIAQQPAAAEVLLAGTTFHPSVVASGPGPLSYQWYLNTTQPIGNATNATLTLPNVQTTNSGTYTCVISNSHGSAATAPLNLTVIAPTPYDAVVLADQPLAYYRLSETNGTTAYDYVGGNNGTYSNSPTLHLAGPSSSLSACAGFDGSSQSVLVANTPALNFVGQITLEAWVQPGAQSASLGDIIAQGYDNSQFAEIMMRVTSGSPSSFAGGAWGYGGGGITAGVVNQNAWTYLALTFDEAGYWNLYVNTVLVGRVWDWIGVLPQSNPWGIADGTADGNTRYYAGNICGAAIYDHGLTPAQVTAHYLAAGTAPLITVPPLDSVVMVNSNVTMSVTAEGTPPLTYQWYSGYPGPSTLMAGATNSTLPFVNAQSTNAGSYFVVVTGKGGLAATNTRGALLTVLTSGLPGSYFSSVLGLNPLAYWPLNETNQPTPRTPLGALNIGTLGPAGDAFYGGTNVVYQALGALADTNPADTNYAIATDGVSAYVTLPYSLALSNPPPFTVEAWLQSANTGATQCALACGDLFGSDARSGWLLYMDISSAGVYTFRTYNRNGQATSISLNAATAVDASTWHHVVAVVNTNGNPVPDPTGVYPDGSITVTLYLDGQLSATSAPAGYAMNNNGPFTIGTRSDLAFSFAGEEDEVAYYTYALSSNTIFAHYAAGTNKAPAPPYYQLVKESNPILFYELDESGQLPPEFSEPLALNYGATGATDNGYYLPGALPASVPGPNVAGFPGAGANNRAVSFKNLYWSAGSASGNGSPGLTGFIDVPLDPYSYLNVLGPVTMAAWVQAAPTAGRTGWECFFGRGDSSLRLQIDDTADLLQFGDSAGWVNGTRPAGNINDGQWHFLVGTWDGQNDSLYVDGVLNATNANPSLPGGNTTQDLTIGESPDNEPNRVFDGNMAQVALFSYALSAAQVQSLYYAANVLPYITRQPPATLEAPAGGKVTISVTANGTPTLGYTWLKGTAPVSGGEFSGANTASLTITGAAVSDTGGYSVAISNSYGAITSSVTALNVVAGAPVVQTDISPLLLEVQPGDPITFSVTAVGTEPLYYQWLQDSSAILAATNSSYTFNALPGGHTYRVSITNSLGSTSSSTALVETYVGFPNTTNPPPVVAFNVNGLNWTVNETAGWPGSPNNPGIVSNVLTLTDGINGEGASAFFNTPQYVGGFIAAFTYTGLPGNAPLADGATFCLQNSPAGPSALGGAGGGLGYTSITPSAALELNIYSGDHGGAGIIIGTNGNVPDTSTNGTFNGNFLSTAPVNLASGHPIFVQMYYSKNVATVTLVDATAAAFSTNFSLPNLAALVGADSDGTAYVGFTAATGGLNSIQTISNFVFSYTTPPILSVATGTAGSVVVSWPVSVARLFVLQESSSLSGPWSNAALPIQVVNGQNQVTLTPGPGNSSTFFKLSLQ